MSVHCGSDAVEQLLLALADDEFVASQRYAEWVTVGPTMEEDNVLSSIAQDEMGHARLWYEFLEDDQSLDAIGYNRRPDERRNSVLVETEHTDFADTIVINFLYDTAEQQLLETLCAGAHEAIARRANTILTEEIFHREHAEQWLARLVSTAEGRHRLRNAFERLLPRSADLFSFEPAITNQSAELIGIPFDELRDQWFKTVDETIDSLPIEVSDGALAAAGSPPEHNGRTGGHTADLTQLLDSIHAENLPKDHPASGYHA